MRDRNDRQRHRLAPKAAFLAAALGALGPAGCAGDVPIPFLNMTLPPAPPGPPPPYPSVAAPVDDPDSKPRLLTDVEQKNMETKLDKIAAEREAAIKKRIQRNNN